jgi:hypothetical protein
MHIPEQQVRIDVGRADVGVDPPLTPDAEQVDDAGEVLAGGRQMVFRGAPVRPDPMLDETCTFE